MRSKNRFITDGAVTKIELRNRWREVCGYAIIDTSDLEVCTQRTWRLAGGHVMSDSLGERLWLHHLILGIQPLHKRPVDHKNRNPLDNRKDNLRVCTHTNNHCNQTKTIANRSGYKGVTWNKAKGKWQAQIGINKKYKYLGLYEDKVEAAKAYDAAAIVLHGEFAVLNFEPNTKE